MSDVLKKLGDKAKDVVSTLKSIPPSEDEKEGLAYKQQQVDALADQQPQPPAQHQGYKPIVPAETDLVHPAPYGSRPGEKLFKVDKDGNITEVPVMLPHYEAKHYEELQPLKPELRELPQGTKPIVPDSLKTPLPVYDKGGDVAVDAARKAQSAGDSMLGSLLSSSSPAPTKQTQLDGKFGKGSDSSSSSTGGQDDNGFGGIYGLRKGLEERKEARVTTDRGDNVLQPSYMPGGGPVAKAPAMPAIHLDMSKAPTFDQGGDVDVNDGKHMVAIVEDGERVLTPEQNEKYKREHPEVIKEEREEGAPADFNGRVIPNPKGLKPILDSDIPDERPSDTDRLPKGAKLSTELAPAKTPEGDISNPPAADIKPDAMRPISAVEETKKLRPYSEVSEEKKRAQEKVNNPGVQTETSNVGGQVEERPVGEEQTQEEKPKPTLGHILANDWLTSYSKKNPGSILSNLKRPEALDQKSAEQPAPQSGEQSQSPLKPIVPPTESKPLSGKEEFHRKIDQYKADYQAAMDKAAQTNDPADRERAARIKEAMLSYEDQHGWGSKESAHPGILGKLGHVGERIAARTPFAGINDLTATLPGSEAERHREQRLAEGQVKESANENVAENSAEAKAAKASNAIASPQQIEDYKQRIANSGLQGNALTVYGNAPAGSTVAELDKRFDEATKLRTMDQHAADTKVAEQDRQDRAKEAKFQRDQARQDKLSKAYYTYHDETGTHVTTGDKLEDLPDDVELIPYKNIDSLLGEGRAMNAVQDSMNALHEDLDKHPEIFDNAVARGIVQTTTEQMNRAAAGLLIAGTGGSVPIPSGFGDAINTFLQNNTMDAKTAKAVKNYIADYKAMKDKAMVIQMNMQNGKMGRGGQQAFESIVNQMPGGSTPDNATALRQMKALQKTATVLMGKYPESYADFKKSKPYEAEAAGKAPQEGEEQEHAGFIFRFDGEKWVKKGPVTK